MLGCISKCAVFGMWCRRRESNPRPRDYETLALPLSYAGTRQFSIVRSICRKCQADQRRRARIGTRMIPPSPKTLRKGRETGSTLVPDERDSSTVAADAHGTVL